MVVDMLNTTIRKVDRVGTFNNTSTIIGLSLVECSTRIIISNSISIRVGRRFCKIRLGIHQQRERQLEHDEQEV